MAKRWGKGTTLKIQTASTTYVTVGQIKAITLPDQPADKIETTTLDTTGIFKTYTKSWVEPGELSFQIVYDSSASAHQQLATLHGTTDQQKSQVAFGGSTVPANILTNTVFVSGLSGEVPIDDLISCTVTLAKVGGPGGYTST